MNAFAAAVLGTSRLSTRPKMASEVALRALRTPSIYATEPMEWVGGRTADLPEILGMEGQNMLLISCALGFGNARFSCW